MLKPGQHSHIHVRKSSVEAYPPSGVQTVNFLKFTKQYMYIHVHVHTMYMYVHIHVHVRVRVRVWHVRTVHHSVDAIIHALYVRTYMYILHFDYSSLAQIAHIHIRTCSKMLCQSIPCRNSSSHKNYRFCSPCSPIHTYATYVRSCSAKV